jgi:glycine cleavage system H protein
MDVDYPTEYLYSKEHEWFRIEGDRCTLGITHFAQDELGEVVFVELPAVGRSFEAGDEIGTIESVKAVSELYTALPGEIVEVNAALADAPETVNEDPHGAGWLVKLKLASQDTGGLMTADEYRAHVDGG